jgi:hypothetical protein
MERDIVTDREDRASLMRKIKKSVHAYRKDDSQIARALIAPVNGIREERDKLRFLQHAENVATNALFMCTNGERDSGIDDEDDVEKSEKPSLLRCIDPTDPNYVSVKGETMME